MNRGIDFDRWSPGAGCRIVTIPFQQGRPLVRLIASVTDVGAAVGRVIGRTRPMIFGTFVVDTGANKSFVCPDWIRPLGLISQGTTTVQTATTGDAAAAGDLFDLSLFIPDEQQGNGETIGEGLLLESLRVTSTRMPQRFNGLLGQDVLDRCQLTYDGPRRRMMLRY